MNYPNDFREHLASLGCADPGPINANQQAAELYEASLARGESRLTDKGALSVETGVHTGRSAQDKFLVRDAESDGRAWWDNNKPMSPEHFAVLKVSKKLS